MPPVDRARILQSVRNALVTLFFGATEFEATGSFQGATSLITESVTICYAFCTHELMGTHMKEINQLANALAIVFEQDSIAVEVDATMYQFSPTPAYKARYDALIKKVARGDAASWGFDKWSEVDLDQEA